MAAKLLLVFFFLVWCVIAWMICRICGTGRKMEQAGTHQPSRRAARGIARGKARAEKYQNPLADISPAMQTALDRAQGKIGEACEECSRPSRRPHTRECKSKGVTIIRNRSGKQKRER